MKTLIAGPVQEDERCRYFWLLREHVEGYFFIQRVHYERGMKVYENISAACRTFELAFASYIEKVLQ